MWAVTASVWALQPLWDCYRRRVGCYSLYVGWLGAMCDVAASVWSVIGSRWDAQALSGLLQPLCGLLQHPRHQTTLVSMFSSSLRTRKHSVDACNYVGKGIVSKALDQVTALFRVYLRPEPSHDENGGLDPLLQMQLHGCEK